MLVLLGIQTSMLTGSTLSYRWVGRWLANRGEPFPTGTIIFVSCLGVVLFLAIDFLTRARSPEALEPPGDPLDIPLPYIKETLRIIPFGLAAFGVMFYGAVLSGTNEVLPHLPGEPYRLINHGSISVVSLARYIQVNQGNVLFATGMCLAWIVLLFGISRVGKWNFNSKLWKKIAAI